MNIQKQKLKNRLNLKFQPTLGHPSHRYSLKKISFNPKSLDKSSNQQEPQSILGGHSRTKSISTLRLPSLQKLSNTLAVNQISPVKKDPNNSVLNLLAAKQKIKSTSLKLNKIQRSDHILNISTNSNAIAQLSKFNYVPTNPIQKHIVQHSILDQSFINKQHQQQNISSKKISLINSPYEKSLNASIISSFQNQKNTTPNQSPSKLSNYEKKKNQQSQNPKVKVQSKSSIHQTLTYLIRNQILTIPKIVALLQKSHSDEFLYMKVRGIYEFEVCDENQKGKNFVTVSRNGIVIDGEMIPLQKMVHEFEYYKKLRKIPFFRHFLWAKFMNLWSKGSKKAQFIQNRNNIYRLLNLDNLKMMKWNLQFKQLLSLSNEQAGSIKQKWIYDIANSIEQKKQKVMSRLTRMCYEILCNFDLPISDSSQLLNKILYDLNAININFEVKIKIQKELQIAYKFGRCLQFYFVYFIGQYILRHIDTLTQKISKSAKQYDNCILKPLEALQLEDDGYSAQRDQILINSPLGYDMQFKMQINPITQTLQISPSAQQIHGSILGAIMNFYNLIQKQSFKLIRNEEFRFVLNVINKRIVSYSRSGLQDRPLTIKDYIIGLKEYNPLLQRLDDQIYELNRIFIRRQQINKKFVEIYKEYKRKNSLQYSQQCYYLSFQRQFNQISQKKNFCSKINQGQYFVFGYLDQSNVKNIILKQIQQYEQKIYSFIPQMNQRQKLQLVNNVNQHISILNTQIISPDIYIKVLEQSQKTQQQLSFYSSKILQLQKIAQLYYKTSKRQLISPINQKVLVNQLRSKIKNFKQRKQSIYLQYRRQLELQKKYYIDKIQKLSLRQQQFYNRSQHPQEIHTKIKEIIKFLTKLSHEIKHFNQLQIFYNLKQTTIPKLQMLIVQYQSLQQIWKFYKDWQTGLSNYSHQNRLKINANKQVLLFQSYLRKLQKFIKNIQYFELCKYLQQNISIYMDSMQLISQIQFQNLREDDFQQMNKSITKQWQKHGNKQPISPQKIIASIFSNLLQQTSNIKSKFVINVRNLTLKQIIDKKLYQHKHVIQQITFKCRKQLQIKQMINQFQHWWKHLKLSCKPLDQYPLIFIFDQNDNVRRQIDQYTTILINILNHKYGTFIRKQCTLYLKSMSNLTQLLRLTIQHQQKFLSLYPILTSKYAEKQLIQQYKKFDTILQKTMKNVRWLIKPTQNLNDQTKNLLLNHIKHFDTILKYLSDFLQSKRVKFQRFYFLQDNQMLELLVGNQSQNHIFRMFQGIRGWLEDNQGIKIGVIGVGGQNLYLKGWVYKNSQPELMFRNLEEAIKNNLNSIVRKIIHSYENQLKQLKGLYRNMPWMCIYTVQLILYTKQIQLNCFYDQISFTMQTSLIRQSIVAASASPSDNSNYITLLLFLLHFTEQLQKQNVTSVFHFEWYSFLKYYYENNNVVMRSLGDQHSWGGQYQGLWNLMINTSDIRRVNTCVLSNLKNANGVLLQGPSGTGKTESLKQLGRCMAKYCVIFNCSNQVNIQTLQKLLSGLCYTASWICLDEINRLTAQIMSVIANQINTVKNAIVSGKSIFNFMGKKMQLKKGVGVFSTMNPMYLQRAKLTQNLKSYFRVISVNAPDYEKILEVMLYSLNYSHASQHSQKIAKLFKNLSLQLGDHPQYDFGMRAIKVFTKNLSKNKQLHRKDQQRIYHAVYETFYSRLNPEDTKTFSKVIKDILGFSIQNHEILNKIQSIKQSIQTGTIILGPTSCKTTLISKYLQSFKQQKVKIQVWNTNSLDPKYLLGELVLGRWSPGLMQNMTKKSLQNQKDMHVLVLDNKLKSQIIQNFNTLLDESKLLTLSNGTRLKIHQNFKLLMQTPDLSMTSPATITRCHVVYVNLSDVQKDKIIQCIIPNLGPVHKQRISAILSYFQIDEILRIGKIYPLFWNINIQYKTNEMNRKIIDHNKVLTLNQNQIKGLQKVIFYTIQLLQLSNKVKSIFTKQNIIPLKKSAANFYVSFDKYQQGQFVEILSLQKPQKGYFNYFIPTLSTQYCQKVTHFAISKNLSLFWFGKTMTGKTTAIKRSIRRSIQSLYPNERKLVRIPIDKWLTSKKITQILDEKISVKNATVTDDMIIYIENVNMCLQQSEEQLRYLSQYGTLFTQKTKDLVRVPKLSTIIDGSINKGKWISRLSRHFAQIQFPELNDNNLVDLYSKLIKLNITQTKTSSLFKQNISIQIDKISLFLTDYFNKKNKLISTNSSDNNHLFINITHFSHFQLLSCLNNIKFINQKSVKDTNDFMEFLLCDLRRHQMDLNLYSQDQKFKILDTLKIAFNQSYKQKYQESYNYSLKNVSSRPKQVSFYSSILTGTIQKTNWQNFKHHIYSSLNQKYYLSQFMVVQLIYIIRTLQYRGGNYILIGKQGLGKKNIFQMAAQICQCKYKNFDAIQQHKFSQTYFAVLKESFLRNKKTIIVLDANAKSYQNALLFFERLKFGYPLKFLFKSEDIDQAFSLMEHSQNLNYHESIKSYQQVVQDFFGFANQKIHIFISCRVQNVSFTIKNHHNLVKQSTIRLVEDFPADSIIQISLQILQEDMIEKDNAKRLSSVFLKLYEDLQFLIQENFKSKGHSYFKHNAICHFKLLQKYVEVQKKIVDKLKKKQDILNRAIMKVQQTQNILDKVKVEIEKIREEIKKKQSIISEYLPIYDDKKSQYERQKQAILLDKKQIAIKQEQANEISRKIEEKYKAMEPFVKQANDCILSVKRADLIELKSSPSIHPLLKFTLQNLIVIFGDQESDENIKKFLSDQNLMNRLKNCTVKAQDCAKLRNRIKERQEWNFQSLSKVAFNLRYLYKWTMNTIKSNQIRHIITQKKHGLQIMKSDIAQCQQVVGKKYSQLLMIEGQLNIVQQKYIYNKNQLSNYTQRLSKSLHKLENADKVKNSLQLYMSNWKQMIKNGKDFRKNLQSIAAKYAYYSKIHPFLLYEDRIFIVERLQNNLKKSMFGIDTNFNPFQYLKQQLNDFEKQDNQQLDGDSQFRDKNRNKIYQYKNMTYEDLKNESILHLFNSLDYRPIIFDADNQALKWLHKKIQQQSQSQQSNHKIIITRSSFTGCQKSVQLAIRQGHTLVLLIDDSLDEFTSQVLNSKITTSMNRRLIQYNKNLLYIHSNFNIILCNRSRRPNPSVSYFISHQVINFEVTKSFLKLQLINQLLIIENNLLYHNKINLQIQRQINHSELIKIQYSIIQSLINHKHILVDDDQLIYLLQKGQSKVRALNDNFKILNQKMNLIQNQTKFFQHICNKSSQIFLSLKVMSRMSQFFSWNVQIFIKYFLDSCTHSISNPLFNDMDDNDQFSLGQFGNQIVQNYQFDNYIGHGNSRATSALSYVSAVTSKVLVQDRKYDFQEEESGTVQNSKSARKNKISFAQLIGNQQTCIDQQKKGIMNKQRQQKIIQKLLYFLKHSFNQTQQKTWALILSLIQYPQADIKLLFSNSKSRQDIKDYIEGRQITKNMKTIFTKLQSNSKVFANQIVIHPTPFVKYGEQLSEIQILILCKLIKPERFHQLTIQLIQKKGYHSILEYQKVDVSDWLSISDCVHPILLMMGQDPLPKLTEYLGIKKYRNVILLAMGSGQSKIAQIVLQKESKKQNIVIIHNLHISPEFYGFLSKTLQQFQTRRPHNNFRLILITSLNYSFDISIASSCHKFLVLHPNGIRNQMQYLYENLPVQLIEPHHKKLAYSICVFHTVVNQLQKYKSSGWTIPYQFNTSDFINAIKILKQMVESHLSIKNYECNIDQQQLKEIISHEIDFEGLRYLIGEVNYVGKLANEMDRRKMRIYVNNFIDSDVLDVGFRYFKKYQIPSRFSRQQVIGSINKIQQNNAKHYGLCQQLKPYSQSIGYILTNLKQCFSIINQNNKSNTKLIIDILPQINHKFQFINSQIQYHNYNLFYNNHLNNKDQQLIQNNISINHFGNYQLLKQIKSDTKVFDLKAFSNPHQFFIEIQKQTALRLQIQFEKVQIVWALLPRQNTPSYGIQNLKLQGGVITRKQSYFYIQTGKQQLNITLYLYGVQKKKKNDIQSNRKIVKIPLYMSEKRQGQINSYGDNTNLLTMVSIESLQDEQVWILRSTAFIADSFYIE